MMPLRMRRLTQEVETCRDCATLAIVNHPEICRSRIDLGSYSTRCRCRTCCTVLGGTWLHRAERCPSCVSIPAIVTSSMPCRASSSSRASISVPRESADTACTLGSTSSWEISPPRQTTRIVIRSRVTRCRITLSIRERSRASCLAIDLRPLPDFRVAGRRAQESHFALHHSAPPVCMPQPDDGRTHPPPAAVRAAPFPTPLELGCNQAVIRVDPIVLALGQGA